MNRSRSEFNFTLEINAGCPIKCHKCGVMSSLMDAHHTGWAYKDSIAGNKLDKFLCPQCKKTKE